MVIPISQTEDTQKLNNVIIQLLMRAGMGFGSKNVQFQPPFPWHLTVSPLVSLCLCISSFPLPWNQIQDHMAGPE